MLEIKQLQLNNKSKFDKIKSIHHSDVEYDVTLSIDTISRIGLYARDKWLLKTFLLYLSGINKPQKGKVTIRKKDVFDNRNYFENRLYLDYETNYLSTLNPIKIDEATKNKYNLNLDIDIFSKISKDLDLRGECEITNKYEFTKRGNTLVNFALSVSLGHETLIINNPTINVNDEKYIDYISNYYKSNYRSLILGLNSLDKIIDCLDYVIILDDVGLVRQVDLNQMFVISSSEELCEDLLCQVVFKVKEKNTFILLLDDKKEVIKKLKKNKIPYFTVPLMEVGKYL